MYRQTSGPTMPPRHCCPVRSSAARSCHQLSAGLRSPANVDILATQHALRAIADSLRDEVNADGIRVLSVYPGRTATPRMAGSLKRG